MFCLQCGEAQRVTSADNSEALKFEDTTDPLLKRALLDATDGDIVFKDTAGAAEEVPVAAGEPAKKPGHTFLSLRAVMAPPRPVATNGALVMPVPIPIEHPAPISVPALVPASASAPVPEAVPDPTPNARVAASVMPTVSTGARVVEKGMAKAWAIGLAGLGLFVGLNLAAGTFYANRVYPGVHVDNLAVGGWTFDESASKAPTSHTEAGFIGGVGSGTLFTSVRRSGVRNQR